MKSALELYNSLAITATPEEFVKGHGNWSVNSKDYYKAKRLAKSVVGGDMTPYVGKPYDSKKHDREFLFAEWYEGRIQCKVIGFIYSQPKATPKAKKINSFRMGIKVEVWTGKSRLDGVVIDRESWNSKGDDDFMLFLSRQMTEWFLPLGFNIDECVEEFAAHLKEAGRYE